MFDYPAAANGEGGAFSAQAIVPYTSYLLWQAMLRAEERIADVLAPFELRLLHLCALRLLVDGPRAQTALTRPLRVNRMMIMRLVNDLEAAGLVRRAPTLHNRRAYDVALTPQGASVLAQIDALVGAVETTMLAPLATDEQAQFRAMLLRLIEAHSQPACLADAREEAT